MINVTSISGIVKEVRTFSNFVIVFITGNSPTQYQNKVVRVTLGNYNCQHLIKWAELEQGAEIRITRTQSPDIPRNRTYTFEILKTQVTDMDDIDE